MLQSQSDVGVSTLCLTMSALPTGSHQSVYIMDILCLVYRAGVPMSGRLESVTICERARWITCQYNFTVTDMRRVF